MPNIPVCISARGEMALDSHVTIQFTSAAYSSYNLNKAHLRGHVMNIKYFLKIGIVHADCRGMYIFVETILKMKIYIVTKLRIVPRHVNLCRTTKWKWFIPNYRI